MADLWELGRYVEAHPDDYEHRWRLAKKLYLACEYRLALEHLQVLQNEWSRKLNVARYLAATLYRIGRYEDAVRELEDALEIWPSEIGLREQLARVLEVAGRPEKAALEWEAIAAMKPDHAMALSAVRRLRGEGPRTPVDNDLHLKDSDSGIDLAPKQYCMNCGAQNSAEFDRCWQCHSPFSLEAKPSGSVLKGRRTQRDQRFAMLCLLALIGPVGYGAFAVYQTLPPGFVAGQTDELSVYGEMFDGLMMARLVLGGVLLLAWPIVLLMPLRAVPSDAPSGGVITLTGALLALLTFGALWAPLQLAGLMAALISASSLLLIVGLFGITLRDSLAVWIVQLVVMTAVGGAALAAVEGPMAVLQAPAAIRFAREYEALPPERRGEHEAPPGKVNAKFPMVWETTGSTWLDRKLARVEFVVDTPPTQPPLSVDYREEGKAREFHDIRATTFAFTSAVRTGIPCEVNVRGLSDQQGLDVRLTLRSILTPRFQEALSASES